MDNYKGKTVLVTGAGGFIGSHLAERLVELGARTRAFVHYGSAGSWGWLDQSPRKGDVEVVSGDVRDYDSVRRALQGVERVFHLAALIAIPYSYESPAAYVRTNVEGTLNVLQAAQAVGVERLVHTSTSEVYGTALTVPISEDHPLQGQSPYSATKIGADKLAESFHLSFKLPIVTLRPFNTYGPRQSARAVIPTIISQALGGKEIRLGDLAPTRDFNFVTDTAEAFVRAGAAPAAIGQVINAGSGREISIGDLAALILRLLGVERPIVCENTRIRPEKSEVQRLLCDRRRAEALLGWAPRVALEEGLTRTIGWIRDNLGRFRVGTYTV